MQDVDRAAEISVARGCGFATLATLTMLVGFWHNPHLAAQIAGGMFLLIAATLVFKAERAGRIPYRRTELWMMIEGAVVLDPDQMQQVISEARQRVLLRYARYASGMMLLCIGASILI